MVLAKTDICVQVRPMFHRDIPGVSQIENGSFEFPWTENDFIRCLRQGNVTSVVAEHNERIVGFMIYELHKHHMHMFNLAVANDLRRHSIGSQMIKMVINNLSAKRRSRILLEVRETNLSAQLFFRQLGFRAIDVLRGFYDDTTEDAYLMEYRLPFDPSREAFAPINRISRLAG